MVFVYLCGNDEKGKTALCEQFKKTTKKKPKYWSTIEAQYGRDPISKRQWNKLHKNHVCYKQTQTMTSTMSILDGC
jgi:hypothetical protein